MKLIVGLGNLGEKYVNTRHNVGFMVLDAIASQISNFQYPISNWEESKNAKALYCSTRIKGAKIEFVKPQTFMNDSGDSVSYAYKKHSIQPDDLYVIHDDLDLSLGSHKIQKGKGPKVHNGLLSIYEKLGTKNFWHVRIGVDNREKMENGKWKMENFTEGERYVLQNFSEEERTKIDTVINNVTKELINRFTDKPTY